MKYFLIGYKSSGKSTLGKQLAAKLNYSFLDLDDYIEEKSGSSIPELYRRIGDEKFRVTEMKALKEVLAKENCVISVGGGTPGYFNNMDAMKENGQVLYIKVPDNVLVERLKLAVKNNRPIVKGKDETGLLAFVQERKKMYEEIFLTAHHIIEGANLQVEDLINCIEFTKKRGE